VREVSYIAAASTSKPTKMASRLFTRSAAARLVSHLHRKRPGTTHCLLTHGAALAALLGPTDGLPHAANSTLLRVPVRWFSSPSTEAVAEAPMTADGLTIDSIADKGWTILPEAESDWRSHAAAVAQSVKLIKKRLKVQYSLDTRTVFYCCAKDV
jgi:peptide chain release factor 2